MRQRNLPAGSETKICGISQVEGSKCQSKKTINCLLFSHDKVHKHGKTEKGKQRYKCLCCGKTFPEHFDSLYYGRHLAPEEVHSILQSHAERSRLRGISRISGRAYGTVVELIRDASQKAQMMHNQEVKQIETEEVIADEM